MDQYEKLKMVGRGAFGSVFLCQRLSDRREVIIKEIPVEQLSKFDRQATLNEVKVLAMLNHPNIIEYYENFIEDKSMMIVMEYAAGGTLFDFLEAREELLSEEEIANLFAQIVLPLQLVHDRNVLHRDLKTQNIFLTKNKNHIKVGDFGISKILSTKSKAYSVVGTPCYISPELCEGKPYNQKSDVWALGCILYEMCTLRRAFEAPTLPALVLKIMRGAVATPPPAQYSPALRQLLSLLLALDPATRPTLSELMAHPWLVPYVYKIPTSLGALPCTARLPRPLSVSRIVEDIEEPTSRINPGGRRAASPFNDDSRKSVVVIVAGGNSAVATLQPPQTSPELRCICATRDSSVVGATSEGKVFEWRREEFDEFSWSVPRVIDGLSGIVITLVATGGGDSGGFCCLVTDRGILLTYGSGSGGCLGHGGDPPADVGRPKIVEALLGDEVTKVSCCTKMVAAVTSEGELFAWGADDTFNIDSTPKQLLVRPDYVVTEVSCGEGGLALKDPAGQVLVAGRNEGNRFGMKRFRQILADFEAPWALTEEGVSQVTLVGLSFMVVLTKEGCCLVLGDEKNKLTKRQISLDVRGSKKRICRVFASNESDRVVLLSDDAKVYAVSVSEEDLTTKELKFDEQFKSMKSSDAAVISNRGSDGEAIAALLST